MSAAGAQRELASVARGHGGSAPIQRSSRREWGQRRSPEPAPLGAGEDFGARGSRVFRRAAPARKTAKRGAPPPPPEEAALPEAGLRGSNPPALSTRAGGTAGGAGKRPAFGAERRRAGRFPAPGPAPTGLGEPDRGARRAMDSRPGAPPFASYTSQISRKACSFSQYLQTKVVEASPAAGVLRRNSGERPSWWAGADTQFGFLQEISSKA